MNKMNIILNGILLAFGMGENIFPESSQQTDREALLSDWKAIGMDMRNAIGQYETENRLSR